MTLDLTQLLLAFITGFFSIATIVAGAWINSRMKDQTAAVALGAAVKNSLGAMQQATEKLAVGIRPNITIPLIPGVSPIMAVGVQYVLNHAGDEAARFGITPAAIADKINAQVGLASIASNVAAASSPAATPQPLAPVPAPQQPGQQTAPGAISSPQLVRTPTP